MVDSIWKNLTWVIMIILTDLWVGLYAEFDDQSIRGGKQEMRLLSSLIEWPMEESWLWLMLSRISQVSIVLIILGIIFFVGFIIGRASVKIQLQSDESKFDPLRSELFETLSHTVRMRILQCLGEEQLNFSELKRRVGIESSGHIQFHLEKLDGLIKVTPEGKYTLTDDGKEALRLVGLA